MATKVALVLAQELNADGTPAQQTRERIAAALEYLPRSPTILSGGCIGMYGSHNMSESMRKYALTIGFQPEQLIMEPLSSETVGQLIFTRWGVLEPRGLKELVIFSHDWHIPRVLAEAKLLLGNNFHVEGHSLPSANPVDLTYGSYKSFLTTFEGVDFESERQVLDTLLAKHPRYSPHAEQFRTMFERLKAENSRAV